MIRDLILKESGLILLIAVIIALLYNYSRQDPLPLIGEEREVDFSQSDSLLIALRIQDSINRAADSLNQISLSREDSLLAAMNMQDSLNKARQDSVKRTEDSLTAEKKRIADSLNAVKKDSAQNMVRPVDIKIDFAKALFDKRFVFIDARDEPDYNAGHIQGAINIPYKKLDQFKDKLFSMPKDKAYVVYCSQACDVSIDLAYAMAKEGYNKVYIFHGGWDEWKGAGYPAN